MAPLNLRHARAPLCPGSYPRQRVTTSGGTQKWVRGGVATGPGGGFGTEGTEGTEGTVGGDVTGAVTDVEVVTGAPGVEVTLAVVDAEGVGSGRRDTVMGGTVAATVGVAVGVTVGDDTAGAGVGKSEDSPATAMGTLGRAGRGVTASTDGSAATGS